MECRVHAIPLVRKKINRKKEEKKKKIMAGPVR